MTRADLRRQLRARRLALSPAERSRHARAMARHLIHHPLFSAARRIAVYLPDRGEADPGPLVRAARAAGKDLYLPVLAPLHPRLLWFVAWEPHTPLIPNRFGIPEPPIHRRRCLPARHLDMVITPLVGFDHQGNRLGMGGGFYDTTFRHLNRHRHWRRPHLVGMAYAFQEVTALPHEPWDVPLHAVVTEQGLITCRPHPELNTKDCPCPTG
ncbi:5-formyltetrahydrofolate cyclo-ligase [Ectothiorhodospira shaposhnikovii]|uniref:5-formyltetrahydrofolate cyclo-ligase n=1 Tax=Ectothiorhodospira shaposhnikovii TaxID=1054 RepID=UPI0019070D42|nr:5-formyltetrahydrofolate cyclo-ligase [Ectothiorhodospira shaposhnikovii]MBK1672592.1 5-formyltetrahydrofolate cyclo-ligase [Ectothiorhodospira shaposhnikovii]